MTVDEKIELMSSNQEFGTYAFYNGPIERLGIPALRMQDSASGIHAHGWQTTNTGEQATAFPSAQALGATWSRETTERYAAQVAAETRASGGNVLLSPVGDILRNPYWGRTNESPSEDPIQTGDYLTDFTEVLQDNDVIATLKHYFAYTQETNRNRGSNTVASERALREVYALPYEAAIADADPGAIMCSYNKINGDYSCENPHTLRGYLDKFGFTGFVDTDYGAGHTTQGALNAGVDMETGNKDVYSQHLTEAFQNGEVSEARLDESCLNILRTMFRLNVFDNPVEPGPLDVEAGSEVAQAVQEQAITLLKNEGNALPLAGDAKKIAVIGADADHNAIGGGTPFVLATEKTTPLDGITERAEAAGATVEWVEGNDPANGANMLESRDMTAVPSSVLSPNNGQGTGLDASFWRNNSFQGAPDEQRIARQVNYDVGILSTLDAPGPSQVPPPPVNCATCPGSAVYEGYITPPTTGAYSLALTGFGDATLELDGEQVAFMDGATGTRPYVETPVLNWVAGEAHKIRVAFEGNAPYEILNDGTVLLQWRTPEGALSPGIQEAVEAAKNSDVAIVYAYTIEGESHDRVSLKLPQSGDQLIEAVAAANPNTIVVLATAGTVTMPWLDDVKGVVQTYFGGQQQGAALGRVLWGDVNPSGKLTITYPASEDAVLPSVRPPYENSTEDVDVEYSEEVAVGYKGYEKAGITPLFPFGYGLSYTSFDYSGLEIPSSVPLEAVEETPIDVNFTIANTGATDGDEVAQVYLGLPESTGEPKRLVGYTRVSTEAGSSTDVSIQIDPGASTHPLGYFDTASDSWKIAPGTYSVYVGGSSSDAALQGTFTVEPEAQKVDAVVVGVPRPLIGTSKTNFSLWVYVRPLAAGVVAEGEVTVQVNGKTFDGTLKNGRVLVKVGKLPVGANSVVIDYAGSDTVNAASGRSLIVVRR